MSIVRIKELFTDSDGNLDYIASVTSGWHYLVLMSILSYIQKERKREISGYVFVCEHPKGGFYFESDDYVSPDELGIRIIKLKVSDTLKYENFSEKLVRNKPLFLISPQSAWAKLMFYCRKNVIGDVRSILLDEGTGNYNSFKDAISWIIYMEGGLRAGYQHASKRFASSLIGTFTGIKSYRWLMLKKGSTGRLEANCSVVNELRHIICLQEKNAKHINLSQKYALLLTDSVEEDVLDKTDLKRLLSSYKTIRDLFNSHGIKLFVKAHPGDDGCRYKDEGLSLLDTKKPLELFLADVIERPFCVCGMSSTALVTSGLLFNVPAYSIHQYLQNNRVVKNKKYMKISRDFSDKYIEIVGQFSEKIIST